MRLKLVYVVMLFFCALQFSFAQKTISGVVKDDTGEPVPLATVILKGTSHGVATELDGHYSIQARPGDILIFTAIGFEDQEVKVGNNTKLNIVLKTEVQQIEGVVVVAYGKQKKEAIVGAVTTIDKDVLQKQQAPSVVSALQGSTTGVNIISSGGQPGDNPSIFIRGVGSINASTSPLIILDGVPFNGNINNISQDQVESMTVLKDASSTSLYGSRAANGVILITTKSGKLNTKPTFNFTTLAGYSEPSVKLHQTLRAEEFMKYTWQAIRNKAMYSDNQSEAAASQTATNTLITRLGYNPYNVTNPIGTNGEVVNGASLLWDTDWEKELLNRAGFKQEYRFDVSGGSEDTKYFFGVDYLKMDGSVKTSSFERIGLRVNVDSRLQKWLNVGVKTSYNTTQQNYPLQSGNGNENTGQWIYSVASIYPVFLRDASGNYIYDEAGQKIYDYGNYGNGLNQARPVLSNGNALGSLYNNKDLRNRYNIIANGYAEVLFTDYLSFKTQLGYEQYFYNKDEYTHYKYGAAANVKGRVSQTRNQTRSLNFSNLLDFNKNFGKHGVNAQGIFEAYQYTFDAFDAQGTGFLPNVKVLNGAIKPESVGGYVNQERLVSYLGRLAYNYDDRYFLEGSFRTDGSSRFAPENRWGNFYSVGASWIISREEFFKKLHFINNLKLRASYGELGNKSMDSYFPYLNDYNTTDASQLNESGIRLGALHDYNITWEKTGSANIGLDFAFFKSRFSGSVEYFEKASIDLIYKKPIPGSTGNKSILTNVGSIKNYGWEIDLNSVNIRKDKIFWRTNLNLSFIKNRITELTQKSFINGSKRWEVGRSLYDFFMPVWAGVNPDNGLPLWKTKDGVTSDYSVASKEENKEYVGSSLPDFTGGFTNYVKIGNFDMNILFNFSFGSKVYDYSYAELMAGFSSAGRQQSVNIKNAWTPNNRYTDVPLNTTVNNNNARLSTRFLFNNDYVRLKALSLGYNVPQETIQSIGASNLRVFIQGDNLWTWQSHDGIEPEQGIGGTTDSRSYGVKTVSLGVTLSF